MAQRKTNHTILFRLYRNKREEELPILRDAIEFFLDNLLKRCTIDHQVNVKVVFRPNVVADDTGQLAEGLVYPDTINGVEWYIIHLNVGSPFLDLLSTLAHEMVHVAQYVTGRLKTNDEDEWVWDGVNYGANPYRGKEELDIKLPWEYDAYSKEPELARKFVKQFYSNW